MFGIEFVANLIMQQGVKFGVAGFFDIYAHEEDVMPGQRALSSKSSLIEANVA